VSKQSQGVASWFLSRIQFAEWSNTESPSQITERSLILALLRLAPQLWSQGLPSNTKTRIHHGRHEGTEKTFAIEKQQPTLEGGGKPEGTAKEKR
jgi:hypothetical protein